MFFVLFCLTIIQLSEEVKKMLYGDGFPKPTEQDAERYREVRNLCRGKEASCPLPKVHLSDFVR